MKKSKTVSDKGSCPFSLTMQTPTAREKQTKHMCTYVYKLSRKAGHGCISRDAPIDLIDPPRLHVRPFERPRRKQANKQTKKEIKRERDKRRFWTQPDRQKICRSS
mmetsp:Transcript_27152/g.53343  ORF Transcript_27152/g.53343 Transcript_27152/m.53343 type:complete len:106 (-) Transcript_27152:42-359(-)